MPRLAGKTDLIPGRTNHMWFQTSSPGLYVGQCAEFCGAQHANMLLRVVVDPPDEFAKWLDHEKDERGRAARGRFAGAEGRTFFSSSRASTAIACAACADKGTVRAGLDPSHES